jgi:hypothetical protein
MGYSALAPPSLPAATHGLRHKQVKYLLSNMAYLAAAALLLLLPPQSSLNLSGDIIALNGR